MGLKDRIMISEVFTLLLVAALCHGDGDHHNVENVHDFHVTHGNYHFYFHHRHELLLTETTDSCFYMRLNSARYASMFTRPSHEIEAEVIKNLHEAHSSDLTYMRNKYGDLLANFHCFGKHIYKLDDEDVIDDDDD